MNDSFADRRQAARLACATALAAIATLVHIRLSQLTGRLRYDIGYDDISYVDEATNRLWILLDQGLWRFVTDLVSHPPHSPFSTALAMAALGLGGLHDLAFYAANGVILAAIAIFLAREFTDLDRPAMAWILAIALLSPLAFATVENFRPDMALGFATTAMAWWFLSGLAHRRRRAYLLAGIALGAALLVKPSFFAHTLAIAAALVGMALARLAWSRATPGATPPARGRDIVVFVLTGLAIAAPYYAVAGGEIFEYFWSNTSGRHASLWSVPAEVSLARTARLFLLGGYQRTFGHLWVPTLVIGATATIVLLRTRAWRDLAMLVALGGLAGLSFAILVVGRHKNEFFFASFQCLLLLATIHGFASAWRRASRRRRILLLAVSWSCLAAVLHAASLKPAPPGSVDGLRAASQNERILDIIEQGLAGRPGHRSRKDPVRTLVTVAGPVNALTVRWTATKRDLPMRAHDMHRDGQLDLFLARARASEFVVVPHLLRADFARDMPSALVQEELIRRLSTDPDYRLLNPSDRSARYLVYERTNERGHRDVLLDDDIIESMPGFGPEEGPYRDRGLPRIVWMRAQEAAICLKREGIYKVSLGFRANVHGTLTASTPRQGVVARTTLSGAFTTLNFHANVGGGAPCVQLAISDSPGPELVDKVMFVKASFELAPGHEGK